MIKGFFFDLDGTLVDTHAANYQAYKQALAEFGVAISFADFKKTIGQQYRDFIGKLAPGLKPDEYSAVAQRKTEYYQASLHLSKLNDDLVKFLKLMGGQHTIALVTTAQRKNAQAVLEHHHLSNYFDCVVAADDVSHSKPSPEAYLVALQKTNLAANEVVAFEDSPAGQQAAEAAGIAVVIIRDFTV